MICFYYHMSYSCLQNEKKKKLHKDLGEKNKLLNENSMFKMAFRHVASYFLCIYVFLVGCVFLFLHIFV